MVLLPLFLAINHVSPRIVTIDGLHTTISDCLPNLSIDSFC